MLLNPFTALLNNNDVRPITVELVESEILQQNINVFNQTSLVPIIIYFTSFLEKRLDNFGIASTWLQEKHAVAS